MKHPIIITYIYTQTLDCPDLWSFYLHHNETTMLSRLQRAISMHELLNNAWKENVYLVGNVGLPEVHARFRVESIHLAISETTEYTGELLTSRWFTYQLWVWPFGESKKEKSLHATKDEVRWWDIPLVIMESYLEQKVGHCSLGWGWVKELTHQRSRRVRDGIWHKNHTLINETVVLAVNGVNSVVLLAFDLFSKTSDTTRWGYILRTFVVFYFAYWCKEGGVRTI